MSEKISSITEFAPGLTEQKVADLRDSLQASLGRNLDLVTPAVSELRHAL